VVARGDRSFGAVLGVGAIAGLGILLLSRGASASSLGSPRERPAPVGPGQVGPGGPFPPLVERWRGAVAARAGDLPVDALLQWILIESGGDTCSPGMSSEAGIFQLNFPDDAKFGASLEQLRAICAKSKVAGRSTDIGWLSPEEVEAEVGSGVRKARAARDEVRHVLAQTGVAWPESSFDFGSSVKQVHSLPGVISELLPKIARLHGAPVSWSSFRQQAVAFPVAQMGAGLQRFARSPSRYGLQNRLEDTMRNAEFVGRVWGRGTARVGHVWRGA